MVRGCVRVAHERVVSGWLVMADPVLVNSTCPSSIQCWYWLLLICAGGFAVVMMATCWWMFVCARRRKLRRAQARLAVEHVPERSVGGFLRFMFSPGQWASAWRDISSESDTSGKHDDALAAGGGGGGGRRGFAIIRPKDAVGGGGGVPSVTTVDFGADDQYATRCVVPAVALLMAEAVCVTAVTTLTIVNGPVQLVTSARHVTSRKHCGSLCRTGPAATFRRRAVVARMEVRAVKSVGLVWIV